ncbi:hypothetical protein C2845_PM06G10490 [Panicum miliaceum]|uniref:Uncharacterized protein n=1 Tax=Panicum miliaceum TaxID=4540 RepID=A0A3L6R8Q6_PANMI|nr:hypothetical protein C2845_PM06G10490 [Panicum miliaceum]
MPPPPTLPPTQQQPSEEEWQEAAEDFPADFRPLSSDPEGRSVDFRPFGSGIFPQAADLEAWLKKQAGEFHANFAKVETKIHRLPPSLQGPNPRYSVPMAVAIGPYNRRISRRWTCIGIFRSSEEMYAAFLSAIGDVDNVRSLYVLTDDAVAGMSDEEFLPMMFFDGCFLLQYMLKCTGNHDRMCPSLVSFFDVNRGVIDNDIMLLENQLPWVVIQTLRKFKEVPVEKFIAKMGHTLQVARKEEDDSFFVLDGSYTPPHLLGLLRLYKTGRNIVVPDNQD